MSKLSVLIPSRNERFLSQTIDDVFRKATGEVEVIVCLDGYWPDPPLEDRKNLIVVHRGRAMGMRAAINSAVSVASGKYLLKCDAHCMFAEGFDEVLKADMQDNWIVIPRRYSLDAENWAIEKNGKPPRDYHYLCFPAKGKDHDDGMHGVEWWGRGKQRSDPKYDIDDTMSFQGSCWMMAKSWFTDFLKGMDESLYGTFANEPQEIGNKTWLGGGEVKVNKKTYYCHLHKGSRYGRMYSISQREIVKGHNNSATYWMTNSWKERIHDLSWLVEKFAPVPTWPDDRSLWTEEGRSQFRYA